MADVYDMSDEDLEAAFHAAKEEMEANGGEPEPEVELDDESVQEQHEDESEEVEYEESEDNVDAVDEVEQPDEDEDSDDDTSDDDDVEDENSEDSDSEDDELDGDDVEEEEQTEEDETDAKEDSQPVGKHKFKANGREYEFTDEEMKASYGKLFGQAMDYTKKMQTIKPYRKMIDAWEQEKLTQDDLNLMIDARKGDKAALAELLKQTGVDALELDSDESESTYTPKDYGRDDKALDLEDVIKDISSDKEYEVTQKVLVKEWDDKSWQTMSSDPQMIRLLHNDVKSGMYDKLMPTVDKLKTYDGGTKTDLEYYGMAANMYRDEQEALAQKEAQEARDRAEAEAAKAEADRVAAVKANAAKKTATKNAAVKRKAAATPKKVAASNVGNLIDEISDEDYEEWYSKLQERM